MVKDDFFTFYLLPFIFHHFLTHKETNTTIKMVPIKAILIP